METSKDGIIHLEDMDEEDEDDSYVPESLRGFLEDANKKLEDDLAAVMEFDYSKPKPVPSVDALAKASETGDDEDENSFLRGLLEKERNPQMKQGLLGALAGEEDDDFMSPPFELLPSHNPAAQLTFTTARNMAMDGTPRNNHRSADPAVLNLNALLDQAATGSSHATPFQTSEASPPQTSAQKGAVRTLRDKVSGKTNREEIKAQPTKLPVSAALPTPKSEAMASAPTLLEEQSTDSLGLLPSQQPTAGVTQRPIGDKGLDSNARVTNTITEIHPNALQKDKAQATPPEPEPSPQVSFDKSVEDDRVPVPPKREPVVPTTNRVPSKSQSPSVRKVGRETVTTPSRSHRTPTKGKGSSRAATPTTPSGTSTPVNRYNRKETSNNEMHFRPSPDDRPREISFLPQQQTGSTPASFSPGDDSLDLGDIPMDVTPVKSRTGYQSHKNTPSPARTSLGSRARAPGNGVSPRQPRPASGGASSEKKKSDPWKGRKELTSPDKIPSRLLQGTAASKARVASEKTEEKTQPRDGASSVVTAKRVSSSRPIPSRLLQPTESVKRHFANGHAQADAEQVKKREQDRRATEERVKARIAQQKQRHADHKVAMEARIEKRQQEQREKREKMRAALSRARAKREQLEVLEKERVAKLQERLQEKEEKARRIMEEKEKENSRPSASLSGKSRKSSSSLAPRASLTPTRKVTPTIPITPTFHTDQRRRSRGTASVKSESTIPLAHSDNVLKRVLRNEKPPTPEIRYSGSRPLTVPVSPKLSTSKRHKDREQTPSELQEQSVSEQSKARNAWESELRSISSPPPSDRSTSSRLTIPQTPHFQEIRHRPLPKSTAEREKEEMQYFKAHPFKARPVKMNDPGSAPRRSLPPRPLTTPSPFHFHTDKRLGAPSESRSQRTPVAEEEDKSVTRVQLFQSRSQTPEPAPSSLTRRTLTTPEPFKFHTTTRENRKPRGSPPSDETGSAGSFKARPMPDFSRHTGLVMHNYVKRRTSTEFRQLEPEETRESGTRSFLRPGMPSTVSYRTEKGSRSKENKPIPKFHARPMPNFDHVSIPVKQQQHRSPPRKLTRQEPEADLGQFRARQLPDFSKPDLPVRQRDPTKLRSPEDVKRPELEQQPPPMHVFRASPLPKTTREGPIITVRDRHHAKDPDMTLSSPSPQKSKGNPLAVVSSPTFIARPAPKRSPPSIPVRQKDPSKLRSPTPGGGNDPPATHSATKPRDPSPTKISKAATTKSTAPKGGSPPKVSTQKLAVKARVRERMMGKKGSKTDEPATERLTRSMARARMNQGVTLDVSQVRSPVKATVQSQQQPNETTQEHTSSRASTPRAGTGAGPTGVVPNQSTAAAEDQQFLARKNLFDETMQMAFQLQRAAEDELSFHGSITSNDKYGAAGGIREA